MKPTIEKVTFGFINVKGLRVSLQVLKFRLRFFSSIVSYASFISFILVCFQCSISSCGSNSSDGREVDLVATEQLPIKCNDIGNEMALQSSSYKLQDTLWESFRERFPYHIQLVGNSEIQYDGSCILMLSEPTPGVTEDELNQVLKCYSHVLTIKQHQIGYDGWVKDILIAIAGVGFSEIEDLKNQLNYFMFGTDYGAYSLPMQMKYSSKYAPSLHENLNYKIAPNELEQWFCSPDAVQFDQGSLLTILENYSSERSSLYYSRERGFVAWVLPQNHDITGEKATIRKFTIDADLIIGAIAKNNMIAIIGRERQASLFDLPPLRTETLLQLASANDQELAQSYERNNIMACKLSNGADWAPIYLSPELLNTEYGSLLNITDQLLKSWSQNGEITYQNFKYQKPTQWGFDKSLLTLMTEQFGTNSLTFNWNTSGAAYQFDAGNYTIVGLNRVGSLPVSYIPDEESSENNDTYKNVEPYEHIGYNFFSNRQDANLIRAAQYAAIYQIFKAYNINSPRYATIGFNTFQPLENNVSTVIDKIKNLDDDQIVKIVKQAITNLQQNGSDRGLYIYDITSTTDETIEAVKTLKYELQKLDAYPSEQSDIIKLLVDRNGIYYSQQAISQESINLYREINTAFNRCIILKYAYNLFGIDANEVLKNFVDYNKNSEPLWIKTPSAVLSVNKNIELYGGHNIDAALLKVETSSEIRPGSIEIENGIIKINPQDQSRLTPEIFRKLGVEVKNGELNGLRSIENFSFNGAPPKPPRNIKSVFTELVSPADKRGFVRGLHDVLEVTADAKGYLIGERRITSCEELQYALFQHSKNNNAAIEFVNFSDQGVEVRLKGVELDVELETGMKGSFVKIDPDATLLLDNKSNMGLVNRQLYKFESEPKSTIAKSGNDIIGVEFTSKYNSNKIFVAAETPKKSLFDKVKTAFTKAFTFSKSNDVDFVKKTYDELLAAGLTKNDFSLILSNTKDCVLCKSENSSYQQFYALNTIDLSDIISNHLKNRTGYIF